MAKKKISLSKRVLQREAKILRSKPPKPKNLEALPQTEKIADPVSVAAPATAAGKPESAALLHYLRTGMVMMSEDKEVISSMEDVETLLDGYKPSEKLLAATKYLVQPKLSQTLKDRLNARKGQPKKKKGYTPSQSTLGQAKLRKAQMSTSKKAVKEETVNELSNTMLKKYLPKAAKAAHNAIAKGDDKKTDKRINGYTSAYNKVKSRGGEVDEHIVKAGSKYRLLSHKGKNLGTFDSHAAAAKHEGEVEWFKHNEEYELREDQVAHHNLDSWKKHVQKVNKDATIRLVPDDNYHHYEAVTKHGKVGQYNKKIDFGYVNEDVIDSESFVLDENHKNYLNAWAVEYGHGNGHQERYTDAKKKFGVKAASHMRKAAFAVFNGNTSDAKHHYLNFKKSLTTNEEVIFEAGKKSAKEMKRKYLGKNRGTTLTGKPAHKIDVKPVIGVSDKAIRN